MRNIVAALAVVMLVVVAPTQAKDPSKGSAVSTVILATWQCQDMLYPETPAQTHRTAARSPWKPHSARYWANELNLWKGRYRHCDALLQARKAVILKLNRGIAFYYRSQHRFSGPLSGQGRAIEAAARRTGVSPYLMVATSVTESSMGLVACGYQGRNIWGLANCDGSWYVPSFVSWEQAFGFYAEFLVSRWPHARTAYDYVGYAACSSCWGATTASHMQRLFGETSARY